MSEDTILAAIAAIAALDSKVTTLDGKVTSLRVDVLERFERVENRLTAVQDDITVNMGRADRAHDASACGTSCGCSAPRLAC